MLHVFRGFLLLRSFFYNELELRFQGEWIIKIGTCHFAKLPQFSADWLLTIWNHNCWSYFGELLDVPSPTLSIPSSFPLKYGFPIAWSEIPFTIAHKKNAAKHVRGIGSYVYSFWGRKPLFFAHKGGWDCGW